MLDFLRVFYETKGRERPPVWNLGTGVSQVSLDVFGLWLETGDMLGNQMDPCPFSWVITSFLTYAALGCEPSQLLSGIPEFKYQHLVVPSHAL